MAAAQTRTAAALAGLTAARAKAGGKVSPRSPEARRPSSPAVALGPATAEAAGSEQGRPAVTATPAKAAPNAAASRRASQKVATSGRLLPTAARCYGDGEADSPLPTPSTGFTQRFAKTASKAV